MDNRPDKILADIMSDYRDELSGDSIYFVGHPTLSATIFRSMLM